MRKKVLAKKPPREKVYKFPTKPSTRSQDRTFTPSPSPPISPPRTDPMARTKNTPRYPASAKPTPPPKAPPSKPGSSKPSSSKGKLPVAEEPVPEPTQPKYRSVPVRSQRGIVHSYVKGRDIILNNETISEALKYTDVGPCAYTSVKWDKCVGVSYNDAMANICEHEGGAVKQQKETTRSERVVLDDDDEEFIPEESPPPSIEVKDVVQEFVSQSNHMIAMSKEQRKLVSKHENFLRKSRDGVAVFMTFIDNLQKDEDLATDADEEVDSEENGSYA
ncbi:swi5-dependent recombination DNA repair protein 1 homolog [Arachis ipaensis]|uniref:swi5-dependent recombination DNA repair protein 1 homolog n=1 Tax=Arachis ipaensis TaxID=130454 RepID=UPI0007AF11C6|nr:swi5-dependent recombination DNA repair protein 1 homolog [Arachis ipaensis]XP_025677893.1 swi5-dependent recombination DNA repair protein 1 homolog [Arachis hypogaea]